MTRRMTVALLANVRSALIFAGGVTISAALIAGSMGSQFTPDQRDGYEAQDEAQDGASPPRERLSKPKTSTVARNTPSRTEQEFFGDFTGFAEDTDLIDDTSGFDPSPQQDASVLLEPAPSFDDGDPDEASDTTTTPSYRPSTVRRSARAPMLDPGDTANPAARKKLLQPGQIKGFKPAEP